MNKPLLQGKLDGLCSIYAILNASYLAAPEYYTVKKQEELFVKIANKLGGLRSDKNVDSNVGKILTDGVGFQELNELLKLVKEDFNDKRLGSKSYKFKRAFTRKPKRSDRVWNTLKNHLEEDAGRSVLLGLKCHWTVAKSVTENQIQLYDSDGMKIINLSLIHI